MEIFCARLKWLRTKRGLTQAAMAEKLGMSQPGYTKIENGQRQPNLETLAKIPGIIGESVDFLLGITHFTRNAYDMYTKFNDASSNVAILKLDLETIELNPFDNTINSKDFNPEDPESVASKIERIKKNIPLWEQRMELTREKTINMVKEIPFFSETLWKEITEESGWVSLFDFDK